MKHPRSTGCFLFPNPAARQAASAFLRLAMQTLSTLALGAVLALGDDFYVRPAPLGNDDWPGTIDQPFATIERGIDELTPGDTLYIGSGVYYEGEFYPDVNASPDTPITIRNIIGETPILDGELSRWQFVELIELDGYIIAGLTLRNYFDIAISCRNTGYITIRDCICHGNGSAGIGLNYASYPHAPYDAHMLIEHNICYENGWGIGWASGIHVNNKQQGGENSAHIIRRNICYNNFDGSDHHTDGNGIMFDVGGGGSCLIENNLCFNNGGAGIRAMDGRASIINNTCFRNAWDENNPYQPAEIELIERHTPGALAGSVIRNNIIWARPQREHGGIYYGGVFRAHEVPLSDFVFEHNVLWSDVPAEVTLQSWMLNCTKAAPVFFATTFDNDLTIIYGATFLDMDAADYDCRLHATSPGIDTGSSVDAPPIDLAGNPRPWSAGYDAGTYEYISDGDCDGNGQLNQADWTNTTACYLGPDNMLTAGCVCLDLDGDADVDTRDFADLQHRYGQ